MLLIREHETCGNWITKGEGSFRGCNIQIDVLMQINMQCIWICCQVHAKLSNQRTVRGLGSSSSIACLQASKRFRLGVGKENDLIASEDSILAGSVEEVMFDWLYIIDEM